MSNVDGKDRPTARGHRFGPDLTCSECGLSWEEHQATPGPCKKVTAIEEDDADLDAAISLDPADDSGPLLRSKSDDKPDEDDPSPD